MTVNELKEKFISRYGAGEFHGFFSPGRVNLIGEHTDYNGGFVFPCALSFGAYLFLRKTDRKSVRFASLNLPFETEVKLEDLDKKVGKEWVNYPIGVFAQFLKKGVKFEQGADILVFGDVPNGAGLSSSAALEMVTAIAVNESWEIGLDRLELIKMSQKAEHEFAGVMCGIMDQFASGMGKEGHAIFLNCDTLDYDLVPVELDGIKIVISNTNSPHKLDSGMYNLRVSECHAAVEAISKYKPIKVLAQVSWDEFLQLEDKIENEAARKRARHVISEIERTEEAVKQLRAGNIEEFGRLMNGSHDSLRDDYEVTGHELDTMVDEARKIEGVIGSRMTGGGFGGCTVSLVKDEAIDTFIAEVGKNYELKTGLKPAFYVAEIGDGAKRLF
ncbi:MAG: galactokinase [Prolixibacteraceae bacterium]|jgi:galactokinase|nr:galactokinase [Prolixibacteraceae bacterium]MDI9564459.1 galactokinase [Bacteroidota bacterium]NLT00792.1 galactokinase [Bacteroidales bacterium]OQB79748.1 MAG: Galactokinase [Bacteroidetes bacterium ADurb.Bin123]HNZ68374.1 galactokinase [Prolixibacteraceae bacterium]